MRRQPLKSEDAVDAEDNDKQGSQETGARKQRNGRELRGVRIFCRGRRDASGLRHDWVHRLMVVCETPVLEISSSCIHGSMRVLAQRQSAAGARSGPASETDVFGAPAGFDHCRDSRPTRAVARPMPLLPPVISAVLFASLMAALYLVALLNLIAYLDGLV